MPEHLNGVHPEQSFHWSEAEELRAYGLMLLIRRFEEKAAQLYAMGEIAALPLLAIGQEAVAAGVSLAARSDDEVLISSSRPHGFMLARGVEPELLMNALMSQDTDTAVTTASAALHMQLLKPVGAHKPSSELRHQLSETSARLAANAGPQQAAIWAVGEGSETHLEGIEAAHAQRWPLVFVVENASVATPEFGVCTAGPTALYQRSRDAGTACVHVNGLDVRAVQAAAATALDQARQGGGPTLLEIMTYRYQGHANSTSAPARASQRRDETDPIAKARARIARLGGGIATEARLKEVEQSVRARVSAALSTARTGAAAS